MKVYTQKQFNDLPVVNGRKQCPTGDYTRIKSFPEGCTFGEWCSFGQGCRAISPFWSFVYPPPFETEGRIIPPPAARSYWEERLGFKLADCYDIPAQVAPKLPKLLKRKGWTKCERRILESWAVKP